MPFQVCPGVTAALGCAAYAGIPLTHRDHAQVCIFVTAQGRAGRLDHDWPALMRPGQTVAIYMGLNQIEALTADAVAKGVDPATPAAIVDNGARAGQRVVTGTLATLADAARAAALRGPTIIIVGSVVTLREKLAWRGQRAFTNQQPAAPVPPPASARCPPHARGIAFDQPRPRRLDVAGAVRLRRQHDAARRRRHRAARVLAPVPAPAQHFGRVGVDHLARLRRIVGVLAFGRAHVEETVARSSKSGRRDRLRRGRGRRSRGTSASSSETML